MIIEKLIIIQSPPLKILLKLSNQIILLEKNIQLKSRNYIEN